MHRALEPDGNDLGLPVPRLAVRRARQSPERSVGRRPRAGRERRHLIFALAVWRLKWVARIPGAPQVFDAILLAAAALFHPACLRAISAIESAVRVWPDVRV